MSVRGGLVTVGLIGLIGLVQTQLWFGRGSLSHANDLRTRLAEQRTANEAASARNQQVMAELQDLKDGLEMVEEKARYELGMVRPNEILVQVPPPKP